MIFQNKMFALRFFTALLVSLLAGAEVDLFVPSFPELSRIFNLTPFMVQLTLSVNFMAYCLCSLFTGALGDRYGRRPVIVVSLFIFVTGSLLCVMAPNFPILLLGRFFQGAGIAGPAVLGYLIVFDECTSENKSSVLGLLNGMVTMAMAFAPVVGSYVTFYFHWRANFIVLFSLGLIAFVAAICVVPKRAHDTSISLSPRTYLPVLKSPQMWTFILSICFLAVPYWLFIGISPLLYMENMGVSLKEFGFYQGAIALIFSVFCLLSPKLLKWFGEKRCFYTGMIVCGMGAFFFDGALSFRSSISRAYYIGNGACCCGSGISH